MVVLVVQEGDFVVSEFFLDGELGLQVESLLLDTQAGSVCSGLDSCLSGGGCREWNSSHSSNPWLGGH